MINVDDRIEKKKMKILKAISLRFLCFLWDHDYKTLRRSKKCSSDFVPVSVCSRCGKTIYKENSYNKVKETVDLKSIKFPDCNNNKTKEVSS